ncbi:MAG: uroporphyrinogen decarboxylase family protein [Anaerofustis sp.]
MEEHTKKLQEERTQLFQDVYDGRVPKRIPIEISITFDASIEYCGLGLKETQYDLNSYEVYFDRICSEFIMDKMPVTLSSRTPLYPKLMGSKAFVMSKEGHMQHPEVSCMQVEEYDEFIADPYKFLVDKCIPRLFTEIGHGDMRDALNFAKGYKASADNAAKVGAATVKMSEKYGYAALPRGPLSEAPLDFLADQIRSFTGIVGDIRRVPEKVLAACDVLIPLMARLGTLPSSGRYGRTFLPLHMGPFLNQKQFERFWWPSFKKLMDYFKANRMGSKIFVEQNWMSKIDTLAELDDCVEMQFEYGDPKLCKEKVGKKNIISGLYPITLLQTGTKRECTDKAKELMDVLAPGGGYIFNMDKGIYSLKGNIAENLKAVIDTVHTYGVY